MSVADRFIVAPLCFLVLTLGLVSTATASHPSRPLWTVELQSVAGPRCLSIRKNESQEGVFDIKNICGKKLVIDSATCSPEICELETIEIPTGATKAIGPNSFGLSAQNLKEGESIHVEFKPKLGGDEQPRMAVKFTFDGYSDASHGTADAGSDAGPDAGSGGSDDAGGGGSDAATSSDAGSDAESGSSGEDSDSGGCSAVGGGPVGPIGVVVMFALLFAARTRVRG